MRNATTQDFLERVLRAAVAGSYQDCARNPCPRHAAEAVLDACRREDLLIMERTTGDQMIERARSDAREAALVDIRQAARLGDHGNGVLRRGSEPGA